VRKRGREEGRFRGREGERKRGRERERLRGREEERKRGREEEIERGLLRRPWLGAGAMGGGCAQCNITKPHDPADFQVRACKFAIVEA